MNYKSFSINIMVRLAFIFLNMAAVIFLIQKNDFWVSCAALAFLLVVQVWRIFVYIEKIHVEIKYFFDAVIADDFTRNGARKFNSPTTQALGKNINLIQEHFQALRHKHEELIRYYSVLLEKIPVAILILDGNKLQLANLAAQKLFQRNRLDDVHYLNQFGAQLAQDVQHILPGEQRTTQLIIHQATISLSLSAATIQLSDGLKKIVTLNPIRRELDRQEMMAWQNLVQVFAHEIMNSMTPIASLSKTASDLLVDVGEKTVEQSKEQITDAQQAINVVARRADNLMGFVQAYRRVANPPRLQCESRAVMPLLAEVCHLFSEQVSSKNILLSYKVTPENLTLNADFVQLEQVLINVLKNSLEAIDKAVGGEIMLQAYIGDGGNIIVDVTDNGCGIPSDKLEQIFVPFYTSKREGTGIGLFLVKQIMQAHLGSVYATQAEKGGTLIRLVF